MSDEARIGPEPRGPVASAGGGSALQGLSASLREAFRRRLGIHLSALCRNPASPHHGCFDRHYWNYSTVDIPSARRQEAALALALYAEELAAEDPLRSVLREGIRAAIRFWGRIQRRDGSLDDLYAHEHSLVATAFTTYAITESLQILGDQELMSEIRPRLERAAGFLESHPRAAVENQETGVIVALENLGRLLGEEGLLAAGESRCRALIDRPEPWLDEYGGFDVGYHSLAIDYLAKYQQRHPFPELQAFLERACDFLAWFVHPDGSAGGEYGSRNTAWLMPHGLVLCAPASGSARAMLGALLRALRERRAVLPDTMDSKYLLHNGYTLLQAAREEAAIAAAVEAGCPELPSERPGTFFDRKSGMAIRVLRDRYLVTNLRKGGAFYHYDRARGQGVHNAGVMLVDGRGRRATTAELGSSTFEVEGSEMVVQCSLVRPRSHAVGPLKRVAMNLFNLTLGRFGAVQRRIKPLLRYLIMHRKRRVRGPRITRRIRIEGEELSIVDHLEGLEAGDRYWSGAPLNTAYGESARFWIDEEGAGSTARTADCGTMTVEVL